MFTKIQKFIQLSSKEKIIFLEAYLGLGRSRASVLCLSLKRLTRSLALLKNANHEQTVSLQESEIQTIRTISTAINRAAKYTPWESACLAQSFTARRMLHKRGIPGLLYIGVARDSDAEDKTLRAHAWTQCGDIVVTGGEGNEEFKIISVFSWG